MLLRIKIIIIVILHIRSKELASSWNFLFKLSRRHILKNCSHRIATHCTSLWVPRPPNLGLSAPRLMNLIDMDAQADYYYQFQATTDSKTVERVQASMVQTQGRIQDFIPGGGQRHKMVVLPSVAWTLNSEHIKYWAPPWIRPLFRTENIISVKNMKEYGHIQRGWNKKIETARGWVRCCH